MAFENRYSSIDRLLHTLAFSTHKAQIGLADIEDAMFRARLAAYELDRAAYRRIAEAVARHLGIFDAVIASDRVHDQKGVFKLRAIRDFVRMGVFVYMGDSIADLPIFQAAHVAILVHPSKRLLKRARASCSVGRVFE
jgi:hypothetical protein